MIAKRHLSDIRRGAFTCVGWQVTLCDPTWQVTSRSCDTEVPINSYLLLFYICCIFSRFRPQSRCTADFQSSSIKTCRLCCGAYTGFGFLNGSRSGWQCYSVYRCLHGSAPGYLASDLQRVSDLGARRRLRSSTTSALVAPRTVRATPLKI